MESESTVNIIKSDIFLDGMDSNLLNQRRANGCEVKGISVPNHTILWDKVVLFSSGRDPKLMINKKEQ